ncbi:hypothetical protein HanRHA438_Chr11g0506441 [Helianthus annuus]|nr:hypothetical protein HanIR_Chr11g0531741 [Helianthus annuus]KAJ0870942.1 hypothetical protein HanRHA438_Chr11g0506441 [Helianthus annuus]
MFCLDTKNRTRSLLRKYCRVKSLCPYTATMKSYTWGTGWKGGINLTQMRFL